MQRRGPAPSSAGGLGRAGAWQPRTPAPLPPPVKCHYLGRRPAQQPHLPSTLKPASQRRTRGGSGLPAKRQLRRAPGSKGGSCQRCVAGAGRPWRGPRPGGATGPGSQAGSGPGRALCDPLGSRALAACTLALGEDQPQRWDPADRVEGWPMRWSQGSARREERQDDAKG